MKKKEKGIIGKITGDIAESARVQHQITKARHANSVKTPADAGAEFRERHADAKKPPIQKQQEELARLQAKKKD